MSLFDHLLLGAKVDGAGSRTHVERLNQEGIDFSMVYTDSQEGDGKKASKSPKRRPAEVLIYRFLDAGPYPHRSVLTLKDTKIVGGMNDDKTGKVSYQKCQR